MSIYDSYNTVIIIFGNSSCLIFFIILPESLFIHHPRSHAAVHALTHKKGLDGLDDLAGAHHGPALQDVHETSSLRTV